MISILLVDDDVAKLAKVAALVDTVLEDFEVRVEVARSAAQAAARLQEMRFDLMVLDLSLPIRDDAAPERSGGIRVLRAIQRNQRLVRPAHIVGLTAYDDLANEFDAVFAEEMWFLIRYSGADDGWAQRLAARLVHIAEVHRPAPTGSFGCDLAILTALHRIELEAVLSLDGNWERTGSDGDDTLYYRGRFTRDGRELEVVAASSAEMGLTAAAALAMKMIWSYQPRFIAMTGIAAGTKGGFGDILVADQVVDYGSGKLLYKSDIGSMFLPAPSAIRLDGFLRTRLHAFSLDRDVLRRIHAGWTDAQARGPLTVRIGTIASGAAVVASQPLVDDILSRDRRVVGVEMEAYGVFMAAATARAPRPLAFVVKSVCDFGDEFKNDEYQAYAAYTSAAYVREFALTWLLPPKHSTRGSLSIVE